MDSKTVMVVLVAMFFLGVTFMAGHDLGRRNLVIDIDSYGCEKVIENYHGIKK